MKKLMILIALFGLSACTSAQWAAKSDAEKQAWIFGGAIVLGAIALSKQEDNITQDNCFESLCER